MKIIVLNGPNLNMLGSRPGSHYGTLKLEDIEKLLIKEFNDCEFSFFQSNLEGELVELIQTAGSKYDGLIINPGGYSHTSVAIRDALEICQIPKVEVHLSNLADREDFRHRSITAAKCNGYLSGFKELGYLAAVFLLKKIRG